MVGHFRRVLGVRGSTLLVACVAATVACSSGRSGDDAGAGSGGSAGIGTGGTGPSTGGAAPSVGGAAPSTGGAGGSTAGMSGSGAANAGASVGGTQAAGSGGAGARSGGAGSGVGVGGSAGTGGTGAFGGVSSSAPDVSPFIVVDQFGYVPDGEKIAVVRDPQTGADADQSFTPGATYELVEAASGTSVLMAAPSAWNGGKEDASSGDKAWWFDFSSVTAPGEYYVLDVERNVRSYAFEIAGNVYADVLKQALRMFFYQRVGQDKDAAHAGAGWVDGPSHVGALQDHHARLYSDASNAATERDLWGGWYDAGDYNKYTSWTAGYVENLLRAYVESPAAFGDANDIPESGNGIPDVLDEAKWGMDFLTRMQESDGSVLSIVGEASASPPSAATGASLYGSPNTSATLATAAAFAYGALVFGKQSSSELKAYADDLRMRAVQAFAWADANPSVIFKNNDSASGTSGLGSGQQETDDYGRTAFKLDAATQLFRVTGDATYQTFVDANYQKSHLIVNGNYVAEWDVALQDALLEYADDSRATAAVSGAIHDAYTKGGSSNLSTVLGGQSDPYLAYLHDYTWGSNQIKGCKGNTFTAAVVHGLAGDQSADYVRAAARYLHYLHGTNPFSLVYLSNMNAHGAENSVNEFFHTWFADKSPNWDRVGVSKYGPPPGYLTGGPNPSYDWDACCPSGCGSSDSNAVCTAEPISPPKGQPPQKSYKDFNTSWPLDSWSVTEPDDGYQIAYIRLLSKFVH
jgi:endoglucanase